MQWRNRLKRPAELADARPPSTERYGVEDLPGPVRPRAGRGGR